MNTRLDDKTFEIFSRYQNKYLWSISSLSTMYKHTVLCIIAFDFYPVTSQTDNIQITKLIRLMDLKMSLGFIIFLFIKQYTYNLYKTWYNT